MNRLKMFFILTLMGSFISGCGKQITDYVTGGPLRTIPGLLPQTPSTSSSNSAGIKVSPGGMLGSGSTVSVRYSITPFQRTGEGSQVKLRMSFHQNRPN